MVEYIFDRIYLGLEVQQQDQQPPAAAAAAPLSLRQTQPVTFAFLTINVEETKKTYRKRLKLFFDHIGLPGDSLEEQGQAFLNRARGGENEQYWVGDTIMLYLDFHKKRVVTDKEITAGTLKTLYQPIKVFCEMHDLDHNINWRRITRGLPKPRNSSNDRAYTTEEIRKLVKFADHRLRAIVYAMCSSGIRSGAWDGMKWKHVEPKYDKKTKELVAAKLSVYEGEDDEEYYTFMTPEAYNALNDYMDFRKHWNENITPNSPLIRNSWRTVDVKRRGGRKWICGQLSILEISLRLTFFILLIVYLNRIYKVLP